MEHYENLEAAFEKNTFAKNKKKAILNDILKGVINNLFKP